MERMFFEEKQRLPEIVVWIVLISGLALCFPFLRGLYVRTVLGQPWGDASMSNAGLVWLICGLALVAGVVVWLVAVTYQEIKIDQAGIYYRSFPQHQKERRIEKESILDYSVKKLTFYEMIKGRRKRRTAWMGGGESDIFIIRGNTGLELTLSGGKKLILGTSNPDGITWAMKRLMSKN